jgi:hypothetical protein
MFASTTTRNCNLAVMVSKRERPSVSSYRLMNEISRIARAAHELFATSGSHQVSQQPTTSLYTHLQMNHKASWCKRGKWTSNAMKGATFLD